MLRGHRLAQRLGRAQHDAGAMLAGQAEQGVLAQPQRLLGLAGLQPAARLAECDQRAVEELGR